MDFPLHLAKYELHFLTYRPLAQPATILKEPQISIPWPSPIVLIIGTTMILPEKNEAFFWK